MTLNSWLSFSAQRNEPACFFADHRCILALPRNLRLHPPVLGKIQEPECEHPVFLLYLRFVRVNCCLKEMPAMDSAVSVKDKDVVGVGLVIVAKMFTNKPGDIVIPVAVRGYRIQSAQQRDCYDMPPVLQVLLGRRR